MPPALLGRGHVVRLAGQPSDASARCLSSAFHGGNIYSGNRFSVDHRGRFAKEFWIAHPDPTRVHLTFRIGPDISGCGLNARFLHSSGPAGEKASSKIDETVKR
jgi:hypothetical protein